MSQMDDLRQAGFSEDEVTGYATQQRQTLSQAGFSDDEINQHLGAPARPVDMAAGNSVFAKTMDAQIKAGQEADATVAEGAKAAPYQSLAAPLEAATNIGTGMLFGFPGALTAGLAGLGAKHALGMNVDPKEWFDAAQKFLTYEPRTASGQQLAGNILAPLDALNTFGETAGHKVTDVTGSPGLGAVTEATVQMLPAILLGEFARKMSGQTVGPEDMANVAKITAGPNAAPEIVAAVQNSLHTAYEKTGIGPYTIMEAAVKDPALMADLKNPDVDLPKALEQFVPKEPGVEPVVPGDGAPLLNLAEPGARVERIMQPDEIPTETLQEHGLIDTPEVRQQVSMVARAATIDEGAVREAAKTFANDEPGFHQAIEEIINGKETEQGGLNGEGGDRTGEEPSTVPVEPEPGADAGAGSGDLARSDPNQPSSATYREGAGTLNAGLNPAAILSSVRDGYSPFVGVEADHVRPPSVDSTGQPRSKWIDGLKKIFAPASRGDLAATQAGIMRANFGEMARKQEVAVRQMTEHAAVFDKMPKSETTKFIDNFERGIPNTDRVIAKADVALRQLNKELREQIQGLGKGQLESYDENYLGRIWQNEDASTIRDMTARRPLTGSGNFLKARTIPYYADGIRWRAYDAQDDFIKSFDTEAQAKAAAGADGRVGKPLTPVTDNPVEMALLKAREMNKYIAGQKIFAEMKAANMARFVGFGDRALPQWTKIDDKIGRVLQPNEGEGGGMILRGDYYAPDEAATLLNNHLSSGLQGNAFYDAWRKTANMINGLQLGLSMYHVTFTSLDAMTSKVSLGVKQISRGDVFQGVGNVLQGVNPAQPFVNLVKGDRLLKAYLGDLSDPGLAPIVDAIQQAGGRVKMDEIYRNEAVNTFKQALRNNDALGAATSFLPTVLDRIGAPIFESLVPRQKLGVFFDMAKDWIEKNPDADVATKRAGLGKLWDSVDNRMGQLVYDNLFWHRVLKDGLMATVRSVGWNLGTFRELGGGVLDLKDIAKNKGFSDRTAYLVALPLTTAVYGAVLQYLYTGESPRDSKDLFFPRTGRIRPDGSEDRVSMASYMKDIYSYGEDINNFAKYGTGALQTVTNKANPLISTLAQMYNNQDYFGGAIRNPADPAVKQMADEAYFLMQQVEPFSIRNYLQQAKEKGEEPTALGYLSAPSMWGVTPAPGYMTKSPEQLESAHVSMLREPLIQKYREALKSNSISQDEAIKEMLKGGLSKGDIKYVIKSSGEVPKPSRLKKFGTDADSE